MKKSYYEVRQAILELEDCERELDALYARQNELSRERDTVDKQVRLLITQRKAMQDRQDDVKNWFDTIQE